jgi:hypothetical protein
MSDISKWDQYTIEEKVLAILAAEPDVGHHMGRAYMTAYQIAIEFAHRHPDVASALGYPIGGQGTGEHNSLSQYLALELSRNIKSGKLPSVEGGFLSNKHLQDIAFNHKSNIIRSSLTGSGFNLSMFRLRE